jgi:hypothetical protein
LGTSTSRGLLLVRIRLFPLIDFLNRRKPFEEEEIQKVIFKIEMNKVVGLDDMPIEFYHAYWGF